MILTISAGNLTGGYCPVSAQHRIDRYNIAHDPSLLDPVLPLRGYPIQCRFGSDDEHRQWRRPLFPTQLDPQTSLNGSSTVLRLLCPLRSPLEPDHVQAQSSCLDEPYCDRGGHHWHVLDCDEGSMELLVSLP